MKFEQIDSTMRRYEEALDQSIPLGLWPVVRLDGRSFGNLTHNKLGLKKPFDEIFRDAMIATAKHVMDCGFQGIYAYIESDEISILFSRDDDTFKRKIRKWLSTLAGEASAIFTHTIKSPAAFDARISLLPTHEVILDYFRWRQGDSERNSINAYCYWKLREDGNTEKQATKMLHKVSLEEKFIILKQLAINYKEIPRWQRYGIGVTWESIMHEGYNPKTQENVKTTRRILKANLDLPCKEAYEKMIQNLLDLS